MSKAWMPFYVGDYLADTQDLTTLQHGAYLLLIMHYWQHGSLPDNDRALSVISKLGGEWRRHREAIAKLFLPGWRHKRIDKELAKADQLSAKRAVFGAIGGRTNRGQSNAQRHLRKVNGEAIATASAKQTDDIQSQSPKERERPNWTTPKWAPDFTAMPDDDFGNPKKQSKPPIAVTDELKAAIKRKWLP